MAGGVAPPLFFRSLRDFFRVLPGAAQRFERLPVVDERGRLAGTVAMRDLIARGRF